MENYENIKVNFDSFIQSLESNADDIEFRKKSFNHFLTNGFPKAKDEQWKYSPLTKDLNKFLSVEFSKSAEQNFPEELKENLPRSTYSRTNRANKSAVMPRYARSRQL